MTRPLPSVTEADTGPFWRAAQEHRLTYQKCSNCGSIVFYPRAHCTNCGSGELVVHDSAGRGRML